jgi:hypothetical protein
MSKFVLIGGPFEISDHPEFAGQAHAERVFGDVLEMPDELANRAISEGAAMLPEATFQKCNFSVEEIKAYPNPRLQVGAPASWHKKHLAARLLLHDYREQLANPKPVAPAPASTKPEVK